MAEQLRIKDLAHQRCFNHASREAVARCPECRRYLCRECITEHEDQVLCASCLNKLSNTLWAKRFPLIGLVRVVQCFIGFLLLWLFFYYLGQALLSSPSSFHEGTLWKSEFWEGK
jgi:hypothetical protein